MGPDMKITLDNNSQVCFPGQELVGNLVVSLEKSKNMKHILIKLIGNGHVRWKETHSSGGGQNKKKTTKVYRSSENYVNMSEVVFQGPELSPGTHVFPFRIMVPVQLPSSFEGNHGNIRYTIEAEIVRDWKWNHRYKQIINIVSLLDLNANPSLGNPGRTTEFKTFCCFCCKSGPLTINLHTNKTGFVPGEFIYFTVDVDNKSDKKVNAVTLALTANITYHAQGKTRRQTKEVANARTELTVESGTSEIWENGSLYIPATPPSRLGAASHIIDLQYELIVTACTSGVGFNLHGSLPLTIGTIPLRPAQGFNNFGGAPPPNVSAGGFQPPVDGLSPSAPPISYPDLPPPSYQDAVFGKVAHEADPDDEHVVGNWMALH